MSNNKQTNRIRLERFVRPFLRTITDDQAEIQFKLGDDELFVQTIRFDISKNLWIVNLSRYKR